MRLYDCNDMVKAGCMDCEGCSHCCCGMGNSIVLDPLDVFHLTQCLHMTFEEMLQERISLHVEHGLILPHVNMIGKEERCTFLSDKGRCTIHDKRPGLCRAFPLGRQYMDGRLSYFMLEGACIKKQHTKVKVSKWITMEDIPDYQNFLESWHAFVKAQKETVTKWKENGADIKEMDMALIQTFYILPYDESESFMDQYHERLIRYKQINGLHIG